MSITKAIIGLFKSKDAVTFAVGKPRIRFHMDAAATEHAGTVRVNSKTHGLKNEIVAFGYDGVDAPEMTLENVTQIYQQAAAQGYVILEIMSYKFNG